MKANTLDRSRLLRFSGMVFSCGVVLPGCPSPSTQSLPPPCTTPAAIDPTHGCTEADSGCIESLLSSQDGGIAIERECPTGPSCAMPGRLLTLSLFAGQSPNIFMGCCTQTFDPSGQLARTDCPDPSSSSLDCFSVTTTYPDGGTSGYSNGC